jgi:membrane protein DedA with SNARE-associated domain
MRGKIRLANLTPVVVAALLAAATILAATFGAGWLLDRVADLSKTQQTSLSIWLLLPTTALAALTLFIRWRRRRRARSD